MRVTFSYNSSSDNYSKRLWCINLGIGGIWLSASKCLSNQITFWHTQLGHFVERQATDQYLGALCFQ